MTCPSSAVNKSMGAIKTLKEGNKSFKEQEVQPMFSFVFAQTKIKHQQQPNQTRQLHCFEQYIIFILCTVRGALRRSQLSSGFEVLNRKVTSRTVLCE